MTDTCVFCVLKVLCFVGIMSSMKREVFLIPLHCTVYISCNFGTNCAAKYLSPNFWGMFFGEGVGVYFVCVGLGWGWGGD